MAWKVGIAIENTSYCEVDNMVAASDEHALVIVSLTSCAPISKHFCLEQCSHIFEDSATIDLHLIGACRNDLLPLEDALDPYIGGPSGTGLSLYTHCVDEISYQDVGATVKSILSSMCAGIYSRATLISEHHHDDAGMRRVNKALLYYFQRAVSTELCGATSGMVVQVHSYDNSQTHSRDRSSMSSPGGSIFPNRASPQRSPTMFDRDRDDSMRLRTTGLGHVCPLLTFHAQLRCRENSDEWIVSSHSGFTSSVSGLWEYAASLLSTPHQPKDVAKALSTLLQSHWTHGFLTSDEIVNRFSVEAGGDASPKSEASNATNRSWMSAAFAFEPHIEMHASDLYSFDFGMWEFASAPRERLGDSAKVHLATLFSKQNEIDAWATGSQAPAGAVSSSIDSCGRSLTHLAALCGRVDILSWLAGQGLSFVTPETFELVDANGFTPFHCAVMSGSANTLDALLSLQQAVLGVQSIPWTIVTNSGQTLWHLAALKPSSGVWSWLCRHSQFDEEGQRALSRVEGIALCTPLHLVLYYAIENRGEIDRSQIPVDSLVLGCLSRLQSCALLSREHLLAGDLHGRNIYHLCGHSLTLEYAKSLAPAGIDNMEFWMGSSEDADGLSPLHYAFRFANHLLLEHIIPILKRSHTVQKRKGQQSLNSVLVRRILRSGESVYHLAIDRADEAMALKMLVFIERAMYSPHDVLIDPDLMSEVVSITKRAESLLHVCARRGLSSVLDHFISAYASILPKLINGCDDEGMTALSIAASVGAANVVHSLLAVPGCDANIPNDRGEVPLHLAVQSGHRIIVSELIHNGAMPRATNDERRTVFHAVAELGTSDESSELICQQILMLPGAPKLVLESRTVAGQTPLHVAIQNCSGDCGMLLLSAAGRQTSIVDNEGNSPLHLMYSLHPEDWIVVPSMLKLHDRMVKQSPDILLRKNHANFTPLALAASTQSVQVMDTLLKALGTLPGGLEKQHTALCELVRVISRFGPVEVLQIVLDAYPDVVALTDADAENCMTPLLSAIEGQQREVALYMIMSGCRCDLSHDSKYPLLSALEHNMPEVALAIVETNPFDVVHAVDVSLRNAIHLVVILGIEPLLDRILESFGSESERIGYLNGRDCGGATPLHYAYACNRSRDLIQKLLSLGADPSVRDSDGRLPVDFADGPGQDRQGQ